MQNFLTFPPCPSGTTRTPAPRGSSPEQGRRPVPGCVWKSKKIVFLFLFYFYLRGKQFWHHLAYAPRRECANSLTLALRNWTCLFGFKSSCSKNGIFFGKWQFLSSVFLYTCFPHPAGSLRRRSPESSGSWRTCASPPGGRTAGTWFFLKKKFHCFIFHIFLFFCGNLLVEYRPSLAPSPKLQETLEKNVCSKEMKTTFKKILLWEN